MLCCVEIPMCTLRSSLDPNHITGVWTLFPKVKQKTLRSSQTAGERRLFNETLEGKRLPKEGDVSFGWKF